MSRPIRFTFILGLAALATALAAAGGWRFARASAPLSGPIIIVSIDTLRADRLPAYGYAAGHTPAIDALAADGVVFERAYAHAPQTLPAHAAMLTGRLPFEIGVRDNVGFTLKTGERTLAQVLRERGYATGAVVSAFALRKDTGIGQGFDFFDGEMTADAKPGTAGQIKRDGAKSEAIAERWLQSIGSSRALLFLHLDEPHQPYALPEKFAERTGYDAAVEYSDEIVGRLVRYLKSHQLYDRSTIVLLSDHGEGLSTHGESAHGLFLYDEAVHVPLIVKQEGNVGAGRRVASIVQQIDVMPTILELVKTSVPASLRGRSLRPLLDGGAQMPPRPIYAEAFYGRYHFGWSELTSVTDDRYRYIKAPAEELYDLRADPREQRNLAGDPASAERLKTLRAALDELTAGSKIQPAADEASTDVRERLQALGYLGGGADTAATATDERPDPKDKVQTLERYREAIDQASGRHWREAVAQLQHLTADEPDQPDLWRQIADLAGRMDRAEVAADAFKHYVALRPSAPDGYLGAAAAALKQRKFDEARTQAAHAAELAPETDRRSRAAAHELLARIALARRDADTARSEADLAHEADPRLPLPAFVEARVAYDQGRYQDALPLFEQAIDEQKKAGGPLQDLHYYAGDTYSRLERNEEAEAQFTAELRAFPYNIRARAGLAALYHTTDRDEAASSAIAEMTDIVPTPESYAIAARLWTQIGNRLQAEAIRTEMRERFPDSRRRTAAQP